MGALDAVRGAVAYRSAKKHPEHEQRDICDEHDDLSAHPLAEAYEPSPEFEKIRLGANAGASEVARVAAKDIIGGGKILKTVPGMGTVYDWRASSWTPANGGKITPLVFVQHIPVVPNMAGIADFVRLRDVLVAQGLMVQNATDREGNVALYTPMNVLCYQAKGANQTSCGTEHMHMTVNEEWSKRQLRASAWLVNQALEKHGIPAYEGKLASGAGVVRVLSKGQTSHKRVSQAAGYNDRIDPGAGYDFEYVRYCVIKYRSRIQDGVADTKGFEGL